MSGVEIFAKCNHKEYMGQVCALAKMCTRSSQSLPSGVRVGTLDCKETFFTTKPKCDKYSPDRPQGLGPMSGGGMFHNPHS